MSSLASSYPLAEVTVPATGNTPVQLDSGGRSFRSGVSITNLSSTGTMYVRVQTDGATAPTSSNLTSATGWMFAVPPGATVVQPWSQKVNLYAVGTSSIACTVAEIDTEGDMMSFGSTGDASGLSEIVSAVNTGSNKVKIEASWIPTPVTATGTYLTGAGSLGALMFSNSSAGALTFTIYDAESATGTAKIPATTVAAGGNLTWSPMGLSFSVGIHVVLSGAGITGTLAIGG